MGTSDSIDSHIKKAARYPYIARQIFSELLFIFSRYAQAYNATLCYCINFVGFDFSVVPNWIAAGTINVTVGNIVKTVHLVHVYYGDTIAFGPNCVTPTQIYVGPNDACIVPR